MAVSIQQKVDLLYKQAFGVTKTDTEINKSPSNETIPSPLLLRGDTIWINSGLIPTVAAAVPSVVAAYTDGNAVECIPDVTTTPVGGIYPTWLTNLTDWIPQEFGATYNVRVWVDNPGVADPTLTGTQIFAAGSGGVGEFYYNYVSGVLNFIGGTIPAALTSGKVLYIVGYRYIGSIGLSGGGAGSAITNGTSSVDIPYANDGVLVTANGSLITAFTSDSGGLNRQAQFSGALVVGTSLDPGTVNFINTSNVSLGGVANLHITGGTSGQVLTTDGNGGLSWTTVGGGGAVIGNVSINNTTISTTIANSNLNLAANGTGVISLNTNTVANANLTVNGVTSLQNVTAEFFGANSITVGLGPNAFSESVVYSSITNTPDPDQQLYNIDATTISGADYVIITTDSSAASRQITKISTVVYGNNLSYNETSTMLVGNYLGDWTLELTTGNVSLAFSPASANTMIHKMLITKYKT